MIELRKIKTSDTSLYRFMEELMEEAFPKNERRPLADLRRYTEEEKDFHVCIIENDKQPIGLFNYWEFKRFCLLEHFATIEGERNKGFGAKTLELAIKRLLKPIVLEVEPPKDDLTRRRIAFYQRCDFVLWDADYTHPPYPDNIGDSHMKLMVYGNLDCKKDFQYVQRAICINVYGALIHSIAK
jgi:GNAT superfamily N-acetyltransferase